MRWRQRHDARRVSIGLVLMLVGCLLGAAPTERKKPLNIPRDRAAWETRRPQIRATVLQALGPMPPRPAQPRATFEPVDMTAFGVTLRGSEIRLGGRDAIPPYTLRRVAFPSGAGLTQRGYLATPGRPDDEKRPAILFLSDDPDAPGGPLGYRRDIGDPPAFVLARSGFHVLAPETGARTPPGPSWLGSPAGPDRWAATLSDDLAALDLLLAQPGVDPRRVGVVGVGSGGMRAWWLMALDERIACGVAVGGITRLSDWFVAHRKEAPVPAPWADTLLASFDTEAAMALCAPRHLQILGGDTDPLAPESGFITLRDTCKKVYKLYGEEGPAYTLFGDNPGGLNWLSWAAVIETFDKQFLAQGPSKLGHEPEPEPRVDASWVNPAEHGLAGWTVEMSQRTATWSWQDGVIACRPGPFEYGWLRLPVELSDFLLRVEWKVPKGGNSGIFLRARPVDWTMPPSDKNKQRVATRGESWPSRTGLELQAQDDPGHADKYSSGSLYRHAAPTANPSRSPDEWNRYTVRARGPRVEVWCNGQQVLDTTLSRSPLLREVPLRGYIGLQNHGAPAEFRGIRYRDLTRP